MKGSEGPPAERPCEPAETIMSQPFEEPQDPEKQRQESGREPEAGRGSSQPFDNSGLDDIPQPRSDDPPYRNWWVVETCGRESAPAAGSTGRGKSS